MTRKDYIALASGLKIQMPVGSTAEDHAQLCQWEDDCLAVAIVLMRDNPRFDRAKFLKACGVEQ